MLSQTKPVEITDASSTLDTLELARTFPTLGTFATVIITSNDCDVDLQLLMQQTDSLLQRLDLQLGRFAETGELYQLNRTNSIQLDTELGYLIMLSDTLVRQTNGYFDPTLGPVSLVWGFPESRLIPDSSDITDALQLTGWETVVTITDSVIYTEENSFLDFGAIAKGYAVDRAFEFLVERGVSECLVEVGGEIRCGSMTGRVWHIGVRHPRNEALAGVFAISDGAVATSGDYECFFIEDNLRYSHLLDPTTGYPSRNAASATVVAEDCSTADAIATAAAIAGPDEADFFSKNLYTGMVIITADDNNNSHSKVFEFGEVPWQE